MGNHDLKPLEALAAIRLSRREALLWPALTLLAGLSPASHAGVRRHAPAFAPVPVSTADEITIARGYRQQVLYAWGDPVSDGPPFRADAGNSADEQSQQAGMHHDGMHYFALPRGSANSRHGLLAINHEYLAQHLLYPDGMATWSAEKYAKAAAAVGVSVIEVRQAATGWEVVRPSRYARRITLATPAELQGPARGAAAMRTAADPDGVRVTGTFANCACGFTPWGTYLSCEENFHSWFVMPEGQPDHGQTAYRIARRNNHRWHEFDERFNLDRHPHEFNRFGWVVEIDPYDPASTPVKRTALGRFNRESAFTRLARDGRLVVYSGDDERFECVYKFVTRDRYDARYRERNRNLLDHGTLFVARFDDDGTGQWLPLIHGHPGLTADNGFADQAGVVIDARLAARAVAATPMDRPEWIAIHPHSGEVYVSLTDNNRRGESGLPDANAANPRIHNVGGHIVRWREAGADAAATRFRWDVFLLGGPNERTAGQTGDDFACPDTLVFSPDGTLWIGTDGAPQVGLGNDALLAADPRSGAVRRFLTGPRGCEITGLTFTPDGRTAFVNIQHPGAGFEHDPHWKPWPSGVPGERPRSATVVITRNSGGVIGS
ncbi:MAG TPA: PhoX family phosphatase [Usitatibacteraceae bacterium]|nr:PhoX family phosphatase [Usitatibacteraceae bacterium]